MVSVGLVASLICFKQKSEFKYLAFEGDLIFSQLASVRRGDPVCLMEALLDQRPAHQKCLLQTN